MLKHVFILIISLCSLSAIAQDYATNDTINLKEVVCKDVKRHKYGVGTIMHSLDSLSKETYDDGNLADLLSRTMPITIKKKSDGFSTISLRGTAPNHTAILVDGINLNSLTLGHSNLANVDMFLFSGVDLQLGSSGALYGSDAIGGTINLKLDKSFTKGQKVIFKTDYSSLNNSFYGLKYSVGNNKIDSKTNIYYVNNENRFKYKYLPNYTSNTYKTAYTNNSRKENYGILQQLFYKPSLKNTFSFMGWYQKNWNQIQPAINDNFNTGSYEKSLNEYIRIISGFEQLGEDYKLKTNIGYIKDKQIHNGNTKDLISTQRFIANSSLDYRFRKSIDLSFGVNYKYIIPDVYTYPKDLDEHRTDLFLLFKQSLYNGLKYSVNLRQTFVTGYKSPFTPALGLSYSITDEDNIKREISIKASKGYKIPTLNQRYWDMDGNIDLNPEQSYSVEIGYSYNRLIGNTLLSFNLNGYFTNVENWMMWVPRGIKWVPINEKEVECIGGEVFSHLQFKINEVDINYRLNYFFTSSIIQDSEQEKSHVGKQLPYTPRHNASSNLTLSYKDYMVGTDFSYTGERHEVGYNKTLEPYSLLNSYINKNITYNNYRVSLRFQVNNILNKEYQSWSTYAMPLRNYKISINIKIN